MINQNIKEEVIAQILKLGQLLKVFYFDFSFFTIYIGPVDVILLEGWMLGFKPTASNPNPQTDHERYLEVLSLYFYSF